MYNIQKDVSIGKEGNIYDNYCWTNQGTGSKRAGKNFREETKSDQKDRKKDINSPS